MSSSVNMYDCHMKGLSKELLSIDVFEAFRSAAFSNMKLPSAMDVGDVPLITMIKKRGRRILVSYSSRLLACCALTSIYCELMWQLLGEC